MLPRSSTGFRWALAAACALHVSLLLLAGPGFNANGDDEVYARLANLMATGSFELIPEHRCNRFGIIAPTALAYGVLGVGRWSTVIWPLLSSLAGVVVVGSVTRRLGGSRAGAFAACLYATLPVIVRGSAFLIPDQIVGVQMFTAAACLWVARSSEGRRAAAWGAGSAAMITICVLTKLTVLWLAPFFAVLFVRDLYLRRHRAAWCAFAGVGVASALVFFGAYAIATGDALYRLHAVSDQHNQSAWAYAGASGESIVRRVTYEPFVMWVRSLPALLIVGALAIAARGSAGAQSIGDGRSDAPGPTESEDRAAHVTYWGWYSIVVIAGFWLGTTSFERFAPLPLLPRMVAPAAAPLALLAAIALTRRGAGTRSSWCAVATLALGVAVAAGVGRWPIVAALGAATVAATAALCGPVRWRRWSTLAILAIPPVMTGYSAARHGVGESLAMRTERHMVPRLDEWTGPDAVVLTDRRSIRAINFYRQYVAAAPRVMDWDEPDALSESTPVTFAYENRKRIAWRDGRVAPPEWLAVRIAAGEVVWESKGARLVRIGP